MNDREKHLLSRCTENIRQFEALMDQILPQAGRLSLDIGLLNSALIEASQLQREVEQVTAEKNAAVSG